MYITTLYSINAIFMVIKEREYINKYVKEDITTN